MYVKIFDQHTGVKKEVRDNLKDFAKTLGNVFANTDQ